MNIMNENFDLITTKNNSLKNLFIFCFSPTFKFSTKLISKLLNKNNYRFLRSQVPISTKDGAHLIAMAKISYEVCAILKKAYDRVKKVKRIQLLALRAQFMALNQSNL